MRLKSERFYTNPGSPIHRLLAPKVSKDGAIDLVESGYDNTNDYIQSFAASCDKNIILKRIAAGEVELLQKRPGSYGDFTKMPQTYAEALQMQIDATNLFNSLPAEVKHQFDDDANQFFAQSGNLEWYEKISPVLPDEIKSAIFPQAKPVEKVEVSE